MIDFIQIGAFTGHTALQEDDIIWPLVHKEGWRGIFIEPLPKAFIQLISNYNGIQDLFFENVAITDKYETAILYHQPQITLGTASLNPKHFHANTQQTEVVCVPFDYIATKYNIYNHPFRMLQIDTEGWDGNIILSIDFTNILPHYVRFEHYHLGSVGNSKEEIVLYLEQYGYTEVKDRYDNGIEVTLDTLMEKKNA